MLLCTANLSEQSLHIGMEENLYYLLGCAYQPLQKAAYVLLAFIYENFVPPVEHQTDLDKDMEQLMLNQEEHKEQKTQSSAFRNIPPTLLRLIDEAPSTQEVLGADSLESLVHGTTSADGDMSIKVFGYLLVWNSVLAKIEHGRIKANLSSEQTSQQQQGYLEVLSALTEYFETDHTTHQMMLVSLVPFLPRMQKKGPQTEDLSSFRLEYTDLRDARQTRNVCLVTLINFMKSFPSLGRKFFQETDRQISEVLLPYVKSVVSPAILENEIKKIELSQLELGANSDLTFQLFKSTKEVVANYAQSSELKC